MTTRRHLSKYGDFAILVTTLVGFMLWSQFTNILPADPLKAQNATTVIILVASLFGSLLGFTLATVIFLLGIVENENFAVLRASTSYPLLWGEFKSALISCGLTTLVSVTWLFAIWFSSFANWMITVLVTLAVWSSIRIGRVIWVLCKVIDAEVLTGERTRKRVESKN